MNKPKYVFAQLVALTVLQVAQAAPQNQEVMGNY